MNTSLSKKFFWITFLFSVFQIHAFAQIKSPKFKVLALNEASGHHVEYSKTARVWLNELAKDNNFTIDYLTKTDPINDEYLSQYQLIIQLDYVPYAWTPVAVAAFENYINEGKGGWIGFHHATLLGEFDGYKIWPWFSDFMGGIRYKNYIADFAAATVNVEDKKHPVMKGVPASFLVKKEEWYIYDKSPRPNVNVIASVDENTYSPDSKIKMGDHPVIWSNKKYKAKNIYIFMGHSPVLFESDVYKTIFKNAIFWAVKK
ncbi:ThuA domain-containing protein [Dyadobacter bucti]|uniref:ThuA domain-containing protein n=1 Tax=Dyadobacter bucti TaxID=2572203 RepID=UPI0011083050|nr:ThuA domain-containing protein [Dyadobacter bucti]